MKTFLIVVLAFSCAEQPPRYFFHARPISSERRISTSNGLEELVQNIDKRKTGDSTAERYDYQKRPSRHKPREVTRPVGADRSAYGTPAEVGQRIDEQVLGKPHATEADVGGSRTYVLTPPEVRTPPRWEVERLVEKCSRRATLTAREWCMESGD